VSSTKRNRKPFNSGFVVGILLFLVICLLGGLTYFALKDNVIDLFSSKTATTDNTNNTTITVKKLIDYQNTKLLGENGSYSVYMYNLTSGSIDGAVADKATGSLLVYDRYADKVFEIAGTSTIDGTMVVSNDNGHYVLLSEGTSSSRVMVVVSLSSAKVVLNNNTCIVGTPAFWMDSVVYANCDTVSNRPWESSIASSLYVTNLVTGANTLIAKSDELHQYSIMSIQGNVLNYEDTYVGTSTDWEEAIPETFTATKMFNLKDNSVTENNVSVSVVYQGNGSSVSADYSAYVYFQGNGEYTSSSVVYFLPATSVSLGASSIGKTFTLTYDSSKTTGKGAAAGTSYLIINGNFNYEAQ
jgi:hypothetical protein